MQHPALDSSPLSWTAQIVLRELHVAGVALTAVNLAGRCFLPAKQVAAALRELHAAGLASRRGRRWQALERRHAGSTRTLGRRRERRDDARGSFDPA